jgi:microcystin-dependent protein
MEGYIAEIRMFAGNFAPRGWAFCQGQILSIAQNTALFALIGTTYGGNGQTTFALPDLRGRVPVGPGLGPGLPNVDLGQMSGEATHTLISTEMPAHTHSANAVASGGNSGTPGTGVVWAGSTARDSIYSSGAPNTTLQGAAIGQAGGSQPHNNMQPYTGINYIICIEGIFPSRN